MQQQVIIYGLRVRRHVCSFERRSNPSAVWIYGMLRPFIKQTPTSSSPFPQLGSSHLGEMRQQSNKVLTNLLCRYNDSIEGSGDILTQERTIRGFFHSIHCQFMEKMEVYIIIP